MIGLTAVKRRFALLSSALIFCGSLLQAAEPPVALPATLPRPGAESGPTKISYAVWIGDVTGIDSVAQTFSADVMLILSWHDPGLRHAGPGAKKYPLADIWNPPVLIANEGRFTKRSLPEIAEVAPDGSVVTRQWLIGIFEQTLDLRSFPFDRATFRVHMVLPGHTPREIEFEPDPKALAAGLRDGIGMDHDLSLQDWRVLGATAGSKPYTVAAGLELAGLAFEFTAARNSKYFVIKVILPLVMIVLMSLAVFWIDPTETSPQFSIAVTSMLTLISYRFVIEGNIPKLPYLTRLDAFILASSVLVFFALIEVVAVSRFAKSNQLALARTIDRRCRWIFPLVFLLSGLVTLGLV